MSTDLWPEGVDRIILDEVGSTMVEAARLAPELKRPTWIMARRQTAARGRQGRAWQNPEGNLAATLLMRPLGGPADAALRSFMAANALFETLALHVDRTKLAVKWPNDVLLSGGKVAGILLESMGTAQGLDWLAIGVGVNLAVVPDGVQDAAFPPTALSEHGDAVSPEAFLEELAANYATEEAIFAELGFARIREDWLKRAARLGEVITARTSREEITGTFESIDEAGNLILRTPKGAQVIAAADVYFS
ncbi:BirA family transcriptional regulator, biotin operon repressor / biotin-[acetyl-CoA-carboxylase] ligase [Litoreibacter ascidiaceicola]|uniref:biotin--[biotin carboxyl-carrier protein] ligase n=1 Tax=Litoreibacter ascidiaceicola TaxID=1486859 RepID=A0A1M4TMY7_9RHOB|nr:biotin--[acetyl-CoA-carboxylase] ligase [Litoreibacter ascidiaceicola]SHE45734.1 BirA family transcriptional regulator, biotin operon repressor / biotin-[acetyl-CoA-carboxylase] ligase [Litoreibacter ascidiaceicola]